MKPHCILLATAAIVLLGSASSHGQYYTAYYYPATTYTQPTLVGYAAPATTSYRVTTVPTTTYTYGLPPAPTMVYYAPPPTTVYYAATPVLNNTYRPLVGQGITRVGYRTPVVTYRPVVNTYQTYYPWW
jgi:hypothetical protein